MLNKKFSIIAFLGVLFAFSPLSANESHDDHEEHEELVLSDKVMKNYGIEVAVLEENTPFVLPREAFVNAQGEYFLYKQEEANVFEQIEIQFIKKTKSEIFFTSDELSAGDEIVVKGAKFLRVILLDKEGGEVGHAH